MRLDAVLIAVDVALALGLLAAWWWRRSRRTVVIVETSGPLVGRHGAGGGSYQERHDDTAEVLGMLGYVKALRDVPAWDTLPPGRPAVVAGPLVLAAEPYERPAVVDGTDAEVLEGSPLPPWDVPTTETPALGSDEDWHEELGATEEELIGEFRSRLYTYIGGLPDGWREETLLAVMAAR